MTAQVTPLDPDSEKGREVAQRFGEVLAQIIVEIRTRRQGEQRKHREPAA